MNRLICLAAMAILLMACSDKAPDATAGGADTDQSAHAAPALIPRTDIFGNPERSIAQISPDGRHVSWLAPKDAVMNVWVAPINDPGNARVITNDTYRGINEYYWAPNSRYIYFTQDDGGDENDHVYSSDIGTGEVRDLTPVAEGTRATIEQVSSARPDHIVIGINARDPQMFDLYIVDVTTGERELLK